MIFSLVEVLLLAALLVTSGVTVLLHRRLKRLDAYHSDYRRIMRETAESLASAREAVTALNSDGRSVALLLGQRIEQANAMITVMERKLDSSEKA